MTHTRGNITYYSTFSNGYPITRDELRHYTEDRKEAENREEAERRAGPKRYGMMYIPLAESLQKETEPWTS